MEPIVNSLSEVAKMLRCAYPEGVPEGEYYPLIEAIGSAEVSSRFIAEALACVDERSYSVHLYNVVHVLPDVQIAAEDVDRVVARLKPCGYDSWLQSIQSESV